MNNLDDLFLHLFCLGNITEPLGSCVEIIRKKKSVA